MVSSTSYLDRSVSSMRYVSSFLYTFSIEYFDSNGNIVDPDQTPQIASSDQGLHCFRVPLLLDGFE